MSRIVIDTDGEPANTRVSINGIDYKFREFNIGCTLTGKGVKMQLVYTDPQGQTQFCSFFRSDFQKFDEYNKP